MLLVVFVGMVCGKIINKCLELKRNQSGGREELSFMPNDVNAFNSVAMKQSKGEDTDDNGLCT